MWYFCALKFPNVIKGKSVLLAKSNPKVAYIYTYPTPKYEPRPIFVWLTNYLIKYVHPKTRYMEYAFSLNYMIKSVFLF